jgi:hypothetical protein
MILYRDAETDEVLTFISNNEDISALDIANIYCNRWQIEVFFKWIKQNMTVKRMWGYSENAVRIHLWIAIISYLLMAKIKIELQTPYSITEVARILGGVCICKNAYPRIALKRPINNQKPKCQRTKIILIKFIEPVLFAH